VLEGQIDQRAEPGLVEVSHIGEPDAADDVPVALQHAVRVRQRGALQKAQRDPARPHDDGEDRIVRPFVRPEADHQVVLLVVDELDGRRQQRSQPASDRTAARSATSVSYFARNPVTCASGDRVGADSDFGITVRAK